MYHNVLADSCAQFVTCAMYLIFSRKTFYNLLPFERIERVIHILHLKQQMNLGLLFFSHLSSFKTVIDICSICTCTGDQSCALQVDLLPGGCCLAVSGHFRSGESCCVKMKV